MLSRSLTVICRTVPDARFEFPCADCPVLVREDSRIWPFQLNSHAEAELHLIKKGVGGYLIDGARYPYACNDLVIIPPRKVHAITAEPMGAMRISLIFQVDWLRIDAHERASVFGQPSCVRLMEKQVAAISHILRRVQNELAGHELYRDRMVRSLLLELLTVVQRTKRHADHVSVATHPVVADLLRIIVAHYADDLTVSSLADRVGYSNRHMERLFKAETGMGIKQYVLHQRVMAARHLIEENPALTVTAVAEQVGFSQFSLFNRVFKSIIGATLAEYRAIGESNKVKVP